MSRRIYDVDSQIPVEETWRCLKERVVREREERWLWRHDRLPRLAIEIALATVVLALGWGVLSNIASTL